MCPRIKERSWWKREISSSNKGLWVTICLLPLHFFLVSLYLFCHIYSRVDWMMQVNIILLHLFIFSFVHLLHRQPIHDNTYSFFLFLSLSAFQSINGRKTHTCFTHKTQSQDRKRFFIQHSWWTTKIPFYIFVVDQSTPTLPFFVHYPIYIALNKFIRNQQQEWHPFFHHVISIIIISIRSSKILDITLCWTNICTLPLI